MCPEVGLLEELLKTTSKGWTKKDDYRKLLTTVGFGGMAGLEKQIEWIEAHSRSHYRYHYHGNGNNNNDSARSIPYSVETSLITL
jgi:hypothetical protein